MTISAQLRANRMIVLSMKRVGRLHLGRLLAFGMADCLGAIGHTSAQIGPAAAQSAHPCLVRLFSLGLAYPGTNPPTVVVSANILLIGHPGQLLFEFFKRHLSFLRPDEIQR